jgi:hypothetical protein
VITIGQDMPSPPCIHANAEVLARYAAACQAAGIVPMIEPEVLLDGNHTVERSEEVHKATLQETYAAAGALWRSVEHLIPEDQHGGVRARTTPGRPRVGRGRGAHRARAEERGAGQAAGDRIPLGRPVGRGLPPRT